MFLLSIECVRPIFAFDVCFLCSNIGVPLFLDPCGRPMSFSDIFLFQSSKFGRPMSASDIFLFWSSKFGPRLYLFTILVNTLISSSKLYPVAVLTI